jgi:membrane protein
MVAPREFVTQGTKLWHELSDDDVSDFAAGLAYRFLLALFPFFIFLTALGGAIAQVAGVENPSAEILDRLGSALPSDARSVVDSQLSSVLGKQHAGLLSVGLITALWAASGGMGATMKAMNHVYDVEEERPFWRRTLLAIGLTLVGGGFFIGAFALAIAGAAFGTAIADAIGLGDLARAGMYVLGYAFAILLLLIAMAFLYWAAPNAHLPFRWITPGAVLFTVVWLVATLGFGFYVSHFGSYNATYGALGGVVILMIWFYITAYIMLAGAELNALIAQQTSPEEAEVPSPEPGHWDESERGTATGGSGASRAPVTGRGR